MSDFSYTTSGMWSVLQPKEGIVWVSVPTPRDATIGAEPVDTGCAEPGPLENARMFINKLTDSNLALQAEDLLDLLEREIRRRAARMDVGSFPELKPSVWEDGTVMLEWTTPSFRVGFNVGPEPSERGWYLAPTRQYGGIGADGPLGDDSTGVARLLVEFVLENT
jgi:hypothetical protein